MLPVALKLPRRANNTAELEVIPPMLALMLVEPTASVVAKPAPSIVAIAVSLDAQVNAPKVAVVPSVNVPLAES